ncbi:FtsP/CotA-like multicopper oxidase with cupredoxin domain [Kibdelosporangium banguiense]|uniref:Multicopper oxidase CueO n=1 Tax=Kibdelosporangium banguiense TaxID=1365924 RepID=A0ABS4TFC7_9PSEU|nr:multicopper oxidase domain-containing protein [Kibdelosporangium banguiense]MBP2323122.1 FtsP/CotA-like multicopper oxidase with cupredoxin domain [Kibdelosporangium banguiense]
MNSSRRTFLTMLAGGAVTIGATGCGIDLRPGQTGELVRSRIPLPQPFGVPLPIPAVKKPVRSDANADYYEIVQREASVEILPGVQTRIFGYDGTFPGPTIVSRSGRRSVVRHRNQLSVPVTVHLHGGHTPPEHDGYPTDLLPAGTGTHDYDYPMRQRASTLWYHDHRMDFTGPQVYRGLAGFHLVHDDEDDALPLPKDNRDIPLMIVDRAFEDDGSFAYPTDLLPAGTGMHGVQQDFMEGVLGDVILVNGAPWPSLEVDAVRYRFRIVNASNARRYELALDPGMPLIQIGSDGGLLAAPVTHQTLVIAPGERFDVVVDFSGVAPGTQVTMVNRLGDCDTTSHVMRFVVARQAKDESTVPSRLSDVPKIDPAQAVRTREWRFERKFLDKHGMEGWAVNGQAFDPESTGATINRGQLEIWRFSTDLHHPIHVHLAPFQVVGRSGHKPGPYDAGWKDTVDIRPAEFVDVAVRFEAFSGRYLIHCHNLEHEDMAMMANFHVT